MSRIFVGNIPFDVTEEDLKTLFKELGKIKQILIPKDRETGKSRGFAFVEFEDSSQMLEAIARFNNALLKNRKITVSEAKKRDSSSSPSKQRQQTKTQTSPEPTVTWEEEETEQVREKKYKKDIDFEASSKAKKRILAEMEERKSKVIRDKGGKFIGLDDEDEDNGNFIPVYMKEPPDKSEE
mgnify:CR=1 FL=1